MGGMRLYPDFPEILDQKMEISENLENHMTGHIVRAALHENNKDVWAFYGLGKTCRVKVRDGMKIKTTCGETRMPKE